MIEELHVEERLREEHIPILLLGSFELSPRKADGDQTIFNAWCCFYDVDVDKLIVANGCHSLLESQRPVNMVHMSRLRSVAVNASTIEEENRVRISKKLRDGLSAMMGTWYIQPQTGMLFNTNEMPHRMADQLNIRDVAINGFRREPNHFDTRSIPAPDPLITNRLIDANPSSNQWFFIA